MKNLRIAIVLTFITMLFIPAISFAGKKEIKEVKFKTSAVCHKCEVKIEENIKFEKGVKSVDLDVKTKIVVIKYRSDKTNVEKLRKGLEDLGYTAIEIKKTKKADK